MIKLLRLLVSVLLIAPSVFAQAESKLAEAYLKVNASIVISPESNLCGYLIEKLQAPIMPRCSVIQPKQRVLKLNWEVSSNDEFVSQLVNLKNSNVIDWFELKSSNLYLQTLVKNELNSIVDYAFWSGIFPFPPQKDDPWFISAEISKLRAWNSMLQVEGNIVAAVIDSGITFSDIPYANNQWKNIKEVSNNNIDDDNNGYVDDLNGWDFVAEGYQNIFDDTDIQDADASDNLGHGTAVASIIAAVVGDKFSSQIKIMPLRVAYGTSGSGTINPSALAEAIYYAADNGAHIINISLGGEQTYQLIADAIAYAQSKHVAVVAAAGNTGSPLLFPANQKGVLAVGAIDRFGNTLSSSAKGAGIDLFASGENMIPASNSTLLNNIHPSGTSFSAPVVTGVLALMSLVNSGFEQKCITQLLEPFKNIPKNSQVNDWVAINIKNIEFVRSHLNTNEAWASHTNNCGAPAATLSSLVRKI
jgi:subtilisin family serine protease